MVKNNKQAFTLVELIVVITILAILWTIAFISLQWYSSQARDTTRITDIQNIKTSLELFSLNTWKYPLPDDWQIVEYDGETIWTQWIVWDTVTINLSRNLNEKPLDPLTEIEYTYSTINSQTKYELLSIYESDLISYNNLLNQTNAGNSNYPKINWNYNQVFVKTDNYYVPTPSIINSEVDWATLILTDSNITSQIVSGWENILANWTNLSSTWWLIGLTLEPYNWIITKNSTVAEKQALIVKIQEAYSWSALANVWVYEMIINTPIGWLEELVNNIVLGNSNLNINWWIANYSCDDTTKPADNWHVSYINNATSENQVYVQNSAECWYTCTEWWTWTNCGIEPNPYSDCISAWEKFVATTTYDLCDTEDIIICSWELIWYTISSCNVWATTASTGWIESGWNYFQWWRNKWFEYADNTQQLTQISNEDYDSNNDTYWFVRNSNLSRYDWIVTKDDNLWWDITNTDEARQWPCASWYHVPSKDEWEDLIIAWNWNLWTTWTWWDELWNVLNLPLAGSRHYSAGSISNQNNRGYYWSSSPYYNNWYYLMFYSNYISPYYNNHYRGFGFNVRCFKN